MHNQAATIQNEDKISCKTTHFLGVWSFPATRAVQATDTSMCIAKSFHFPWAIDELQTNAMKKS